MSKRQNNNPVDGASGGGGNGKRVGSASGSNSPAPSRDSPVPTQNARANNANNHNAVGNQSPSHSPAPSRSGANHPSAIVLAAQAHAQHRELHQQAQAAATAATVHVTQQNSSSNHSHNHHTSGPSNRNAAANSGAVGTARSVERVHGPASKNNPNAGRQRERARENEREVIREPHEESSPEPSPRHEPRNDARNELQANHLANAPLPNQVPQQPLPVVAQDIVPHNWQATKTTIKDRLAFMFNSEVMADVHFLVGKDPNSQRIPAHKFVLSIGSAVFDAMFNGGMATTSEEVELPDVEPAAFLALLRFLYSDEVQIGPETVMTTLYTAKKYAVPALERACVDFLKRNLSSDNAFMLLTQARLFDEPQLAALCLETIDKNTTEALSAEGFTDIDLETLCVVLERDTLGIRECKLFGAVSRWSEAECVRQELPVGPANQRLVLGRALPLIRFPLMTVEEYAVGAAQSGILTDREVVELFLYFTVNPKPSTSFLSTPRCCLTGKEQVVSRFCEIESRWGYSGTSDRIRFMVNRRIFVVGLGLYGSIHGPSEYQVNIQIIHTDTGKICGQNDTTFQSDGSTSTFRVMFKEPAEIQPNTSYTSCATLKGPDSYYGTKGLRKVTHESVTSGRVTFQFTYAAGNNNGTSVEDGQLPEIIFYT